MLLFVGFPAMVFVVWLSPQPTSLPYNLWDEIISILWHLCLLSRTTACEVAPRRQASAEEAEAALWGLLCWLAVPSSSEDHLYLVVGFGRNQKDDLSSSQTLTQQLWNVLKGKSLLQLPDTTGLTWGKPAVSTSVRHSVRLFPVMTQWCCWSGCKRQDVAFV